jgi:glutamate-1-semialdehyde 2,1-aminomutase
VDGNEYVDYFGGHGALILGHNHPAVVEAVTARTERRALRRVSRAGSRVVGNYSPIDSIGRADPIHYFRTEATHLAPVSRAFTARAR